MKVLAMRGEFAFLLLSSGDEDDLGAAFARIYDSRAGTLGDELPAASAIARGYWRKVPASVDTEAILRDADALLAAAV